MSFVKSEAAAAAAAAADRTSCAETSQAARRATGGRASSSRVDSSNFDDDVKHRILRNLKADLYSHLKFNAKIFHSIQSVYNFKCWDSFRLPNTNQAVNLHRAAKALAGSLYFHWLDGARRAVCLSCNLRWEGEPSLRGRARARKVTFTNLYVLPHARTRSEKL